MRHCHERGTTTIFIYQRIDERLPTDTDAYYEAIASQEEIYLEEVEQELRAILIFGIFGDPFPSQNEVKRSSRTQMTILA
jgi:hypothetical protein